MAKKKSVKKKGVNKSQAIRDMLRQQPSASPLAVSESLAKQGVKVSPGFVSTVKSKSGAKKKRRRVKKKVGRPARPAGDTISMSALVQAKRLADQLGGVDKAQDALSALSKLQ